MHDCICSSADEPLREDREALNWPRVLRVLRFGFRQRLIKRSDCFCVVVALSERLLQYCEAGRPSSPGKPLKSPCASRSLLESSIGMRIPLPEEKVLAAEFVGST
jgi:hypothetical protein